MKYILAIAAGVVVVGGVVAIRNIADTKSKTEIVEPVDKTSDKSSDSDSQTNINAISRSNGSNSSTGSPQKTFNRGETAAKLDVTPATSTPATSGTRPFIGMSGTTTTQAEESLSVDELARRFAEEKDPDERIEIADELGLIDTPESIRKILELLKSETDPTVQEALLEALQGLESLELTADEVLAAVQSIYNSSNDPDVRIAAQDVMGDLDTREGAAALRAIRDNPQSDPLERLNAAENLMRLRAYDPDLVSAQEAAAISEQLKLDYKAGPDAGFRSQAILALATDGKNNLPFFQEALSTEQDQQVRALLERLIRMYSAQPPATPPPGTVVTPVPTP